MTSTAHPHEMGNTEENERPRLMSQADCKDIAGRITRLSEGGGVTWVIVRSNWTGNVRWSRNLIATSGEVRDNTIMVNRNIRGADSGWAFINTTSDRALTTAVRQAERVARLRPEQRWTELMDHTLEAMSPPIDIFSETTYNLNADKRAEAARVLAKSAADAGMLSAGYVAVSAHSIAAIDSLGRSLFFSYTHARYSVTVRDPSGSASGWAGNDSHDWARIKGEQLSAIALDKCLRSRTPSVIEPGRYTAILEPQAVCDFVGQLFFSDSWTPAIGRTENEGGSSVGPGPFLKESGVPGVSRIGEKIFDERISIGTDPTDPELGFPPFNPSTGSTTDSFTAQMYHPATWVEHGVLKDLAYGRGYAMQYLGKNTGLPNSGAFRMSGGTTTVEEMIATTQRGLLVTRFDNIFGVDFKSQLYRGYTRDGLWLIEHGKITKPVKNLQFTESITGALNNVEQLGVPQRAYHPRRDGGPFPFLAVPQPVIVPPLKIRDFSFTALTDAV